MPRRLLARAVLCLVVLAGGVARAQNKSKAKDKDAVAAGPEMRFLQGLRERGYNDLALEYLDALRKDPSVSPELKVVLDYEEGRGILDEATRLGDLDRKLVEFDKARAKLDAFATANPKHPLAPEALMQMARIQFERGLTAVLQGNEAKLPAEKANKLAEARSSFAQARVSFGRAFDLLKAAFAAYPPFLPEGDPRRASYERARGAVLQAELQKNLVDYEEAQTYPAKSPERLKLLDKGIEAFGDIYKRHRTQLAGLYADMMQAKCYEEKGQYGEAMGIYKFLMGQPAEELREMRRKIQFFQIIVDGKRGDHALAVDRAADWLKGNPSAKNSEEGIGVQLELAKNILAQLDTMPPQQQETAINQAAEFLKAVVKPYTPYKPEAIALLQKYKPKSATSDPKQVANLTYALAYGEAESAIASHEWDRAVLYLRQAIRRADPQKNLDDANKARYLLAYTHYSAERYYEGAVLGEHLARRYPRKDNAAKAAEIAIASLAAAYGTYTQVDRLSDLEHLVSLATYTAETWPETDQADFARTVLGEIAMGRGKYTDASQWFEAVRADSSRRAEAVVKAGDARWRLSLSLRDQQKDKEADAEVAKAIDILQTAYTARQAKGGAIEPGLLTNANALAEILRATGKPKEAVALLEPLAVKVATAGTPAADIAPLYEGTLTVLMKSHIADGSSEKAIADMRALEAAGSSKEKLTQLYFELSKSLRKDMDAQEARRDPNLGRTKQAYKQFLQALVASKAGQTYDSLMFAGESMLGLGLAKESAEVFRRVRDEYGKPDLASAPGGKEKLLRTDLRLAEAFRKLGNYAEAQTLVEKLAKENPKVLEILFEYGYLLEDWARAEKTKERWDRANSFWKGIAGRMERVRPKPVAYFEATYHVALALQGGGHKTEGLQTLKSVLTLSPTVGNAEMKKKYQELITVLSR